MAGSNLTVAITADIADLQTKLALASADFKSYGAETRNLAAQFQAAGDAGKAALLPALEAAATGAASAKAQMASLNAEIKNVSSAGGQGGGGLGSLFDQMKEKAESFHTSLGFALAGGEFLIFKELATEAFEAVEKLFAATIEKAIEFDLSIAKMAAQLGTTATEAAALDGALKAVGSSSDTYASMALKLDRQIHANEQSLRALGLVTRDQSGNLLGQRQLMDNAISTMQQYKAGADQNTVALQLFGRGAREVYDVTRVTAEMTEEFAHILTTMGVSTMPQAARSSAELEDSMAKLKASSEGFAVSLGQRLGPTWKEFVDFLTGPAQRSMNGIALVAEVTFALIDTAFTGLSQALQAVWGTTINLASGIALLGGLFRDLVEMDFSKMAQDWAVGLDAMNARAKKTFEDILQTGKDYSARMGVLFRGPQGGGAPLYPSGDKAAPAGADKGAATALETFRTQLAQMQADWTGTHREMLAETVRMWQQETQASGLSAKEIVEAERGLAEARKAFNQQVAADDKAASANRIAIARLDTDTEIQLSKLNIASKRSDLDAEVAGYKITAAQKFGILRDFTNQEYALDIKAVEDEMAALQVGTLAYDRAYQQIRLLKAKLNNDLTALDRQQVVEATSAWKSALQPIGTAFNGMLSGMMSQTQTFKATMQNVAQQLVLSYAESGVKMAADWAAQQLGRLAVQVATDQAVVASKGAAALETKAIDATTAQKSILTKAYDAAAGAYDATVSIPYAGPFLAPIAAAAAFAAVAAFGSSVSAAGGYDIPAGLNPMVQAHAQEMILPADLANKVRGMTGGAGDVHIHIDAVDAPSFERRLMQSGPGLAAAIRAAVRNGQLSMA